MSDFDKMIKQKISRRNILKSGTVLGLSALVSSSLTRSASSRANKTDYADFKEIPSDTSDTVTLAKGFNWKVLISWGDPLWSNTNNFDQKSRGTETSQRNSFGDNNDGMALFSKDSRNVLAVNNEYANLNIMFGNNSTGKPESTDDILKAMAAHGVSIIEIKKISKKGRF